MDGVRFFYELLTEYQSRARLTPNESVKLFKMSEYQNSNHYRLNPDKHVMGEWASDAVIAYGVIANILDDPNTKRILFDSRQATVFESLAEPPPENIQRKLHLPFDQFYLEFTEPVSLDNTEPGFEGDLTRAYVVSGGIPYEFGGISGTMTQIIMFGSGRDEQGRKIFIDRSWKIDLERGTAWTGLSALYAAMGGKPIKDLPSLEKGDHYWLAGMRVRSKHSDTVPSNQNPEGFEGFMDELYLAADEDLTWYERVLLNDTELISWCLAYMMAKSIVIHEEWGPRHERRRVQRENKIPQPWHVVKVDPKIIVGGHMADYDEGKGTQHRYRYDVIGHLRFGHHPRKDGTFNDTIEWVPPHQRGLANTIYIPKTALFDKGRTIAQPMQEYFNA